ncbi:FHA domain-containing protein [Microbacterium marinum]|uniref:FHA domain-containing protein n=1 Tax=Microbacterium marinum TaxID=421115 RepID=UPI0038515196
MSAPGIARTTAAVDPLVHSVAAGPLPRIGAVAVDLVVPAAVVVGAVLSFSAGSVGLGVVLVLAAIVAVVVTCVVLARTGRTLGALVCGIRSVERETGTPSGMLLLTDLLTGRLGSYDIRRGRDPIAPALAAFRFPPSATAHRPAHLMAPTVTVALDSGIRLNLAASLVIGRNPVAADAGTASQVFQWTDLSRTMSKSHAHLEWDGQQAWVTDLGSTNGSAIHDESGEHPLVPYSRTPLPTGAVLSLGDRTLVVEAGA